ncbi:50S ribosomal protein L19 [Candidatus Peregrinibacteria bacterium]|nr:MAG: 50S ribosomal protein L19 [Candidatus Peregrinibacteria bacterium]
MGNHAIIAELDRTYMKKTVPTLKVGYTVRVTQEISEGEKKRLQKFEGMIMKIHRKGGELHSNITVRKISAGVGVEKVFAIHSPAVTTIEIVKEAKVRRARLYYTRNLFGKAARYKDRQLTDKQKAERVTHFDIPEKEEKTEA